MSSNSEFNFPEQIRSSIEEDYDERRKNLSEMDQEAFAFFLSSQNEIKGDKETFVNFLDSLIKEDFKEEFKNLIENFNDMESYQRFLASILIYMRSNSFNESPDKFLYLCIAVEAAMQFKSTMGKIKKTKLFKDFFKKNLSEDSKLKMISHFKDKEVDNIAVGHSVMMRNIRKNKIIKIKETSMVPSCYKLKQCYLHIGKCYPQHGCYLKTNTDKIDDQLDNVLDYLYQKRSNFVHNGRVFPHPEGSSIGDVYCHPAQKKLIGVSYSLDLFDLFKIYEEALLNHFKKINGI
jgi:hypothetical protein